MNNKGYDDSFLERLKQNNDIISTISKYVTLNQKGKTHWGICPFHSEKTPSFAVNSYEQYYHCFGCGAKGDVITFIEKVEHVDFMKAVEILAEKAGMEVPSFVGDDTVKEKKQKKAAILKANKDAAIYFNKMLFTEKGKEALDYLIKKRGLNTATITRFGLGASIDWFDLIKHLKSKGHTEEILLESGLAERGEKGGLYDVMAERVMFPIINSYGEVIGFSGRALKDGKFAKYRNTMQTLAFDKSKIVYGINLLKNLKQKEGFNEVIIVEGQMDVIAMHNAGFQNTIACMGTALTKYHAKELKRFADRVIVSFDGDTAGQKATFRSLEILEEEHLNVYVISIPEKLDPDEYIKKYGKEAYQKLLNNAMPLNDYKLKAIAVDFNLDDTKEKAKYIDKALEEIKRLKTMQEREIYLRQLSEKTKIDLYTLERDLKFKLQTEKKETKPQNLENVLVKDAIYKSAEFILASILHKKIQFREFNENIFFNEEHKKLYDFILTSQNLQKEVKIGNLFTHFNLEEENAINDIVNYEFLMDEVQLKKYFEECVKTLELEYLLKEQQQIITKIEQETSVSNKQNLMKELSEINKQIVNKRK